MNSTILSGLYEDSKRAVGSVFIYDKENQEIGQYQLGSSYSLPSRVKGDMLIFDYKEGDCNQLTGINFRDSIPSKFFINCTKDGGDMYNYIKTKP